MRRRFFLRLVAWTFVSLVLVNAAGAQTTKFRIIHTFAGGNDGWNPVGQLVFDHAGNLYGATYYGGSLTACGGYGCGTVFQMHPNGGRWSERVLYNFSDAVNSYVGATGPLVLDNMGNIYGTGVFWGYDNGQYFGGEVFQVSDTGGSWTGSLLHEFVSGSTDGGQPNPGLVRDAAGNLYGSTQAGGDLNNNGVVFEFSPNGDGTWTESLIYQFGSGKAYAPVGPMTIDAAGNLYGMTQSGGAYGWGSVYKLQQSNGVWSFVSLYDFPPSSNYGETPTPGGLVMDAAGNLYCNTQYGGAYGVGELFKLTPTTGYWKYSSIHTFSGSSDGGFPSGDLAIDHAGNIYGTTLSGGLFQYGTVYKFVPEAKGRWKETVLHSFANTNDGYIPQGVILDSSGNAYGVTSGGGTVNRGVAFEISQ